MELDKYLVPIPDGLPGGINIDDTGDLFAVEKMLQTTPPPWVKIKEKIEDTLETTRDLRLAVMLAIAMLNSEGIAGFTRGISFVRALSENLWDTMHPALEDDGNADTRRSALMNLSDFYQVIRPLQRCFLVEKQGIGRFSSLDVDIAEGKVPAPSDYPPDPPQISAIAAAFAATPPEVLEALAAQFTRTLADLAAIYAQFEEKAPDTGGPDLERLTDVLRRSESIVRSRLPAPPEAVVVASGGSTDGGAGPSSGGGAKLSGSVTSRREALLALEMVVRYFREAEPSSPVPILLERAIRLAETNFLEIMKDIAPDALSQIKSILGVLSEE